MFLGEACDARTHRAGEMNRFNWGRDGPPPEAYSRITEPERFAPLHGIALELLDGLENTFDVERSEAYGLAPELENVELALPSIRLVPNQDSAASIVFVFSAFPGLRMQAGQWYRDSFPSCACDACDETSDSEAERLTSIVDNITSGRFREAVRLPAAGDGWQETDLWSSNRSSSNKRRLDRDLALQMLADNQSSVFEWQPWARR